MGPKLNFKELAVSASWRTDQRARESREEAPAAHEELGLRQGWSGVEDF